MLTISHAPKILMPMARREWLPPSIAQRKSVFGHAPIERRWHAKVVLPDGHVRWHGVFEDREDFDAFWFAAATGTLDYQPDLWRLPVPQYFPDYGEGGLFLFAATILVTASGSQSRPSDWNDGANTIEAIGGGGSGGAGAKSNGIRALGGSGAEYRKLTNYSAGGTFTYTIGAGGSSVVRNTSGATSGNDGADTILDTNALIAKKGLAGPAAQGSAPSAPAGGTGGTGGTGNDGGAGGAVTGFNDCTSGAGGAGGPAGAGSAGTAVAANNTASNGGAGAAGSGGAGGSSAASGTAATASGGAGGNGTEFGGSPNGAGGGGGAAINTSTGAATGGAAGTYGAAGGGAVTKASGGDATSGAGAQGILYFTYTPAVANNRMFMVM